MCLTGMGLEEITLLRLKTRKEKLQDEAQKNFVIFAQNKQIL